MSARREKTGAPRRTRRTNPGGASALRPALLLGQAAPLLLGVLGFLFCLLTGYQLTVLTPRAVLAAVAFCALFFAVLSGKRRGLALLVCLAAAGIWAFFNHDRLLQGFLLLIRTALAPMRLRLPDALLGLMETYDAEQAQKLMTTALIALLCPVSALSAYVVIDRSSGLGLALVTLPLLTPMPFYGLSPAAVPFLCLMASYLTLYIGNIGRYMLPAFSRTGRQPALLCREQELAAQRPAQRLLPLFALPAVALSALLACWMLPERGYVRPEGIDALQDEILSWQLGDGTVARSNDGLTHGDLRSLSDIRFSGKPALKVRVSEERPLYLRDFAGARYSQNGWDSVSPVDYVRAAGGFADLAPQNLHASAVSVSGVPRAAYTLSVQNISAPPASLWTPNGLVTTASEIPGAAYVQDTALGVARAAGVSGYTLEALVCDGALSTVPLSGGTDAASLKNAYLAAAGSAVNLSGATGADAQRVQTTAAAYLDYVFETYTALPEETQRAAERLCQSYGLSLQSGNGALNLFETCRQLHTLLTGRCAYAYAPPKIPTDADFTTYFLEESRRGYCVHFATAATVLLRSLGIPARYAEGYIVVSTDYDKLPDENGYIDIEDTHAHAWAEVFDPVQLEWIPVEMTASAGAGGETASELGETENEQGTPAPTATPEPTPEPTPEATPETTPDAVGEPEPPQSAEPSQTPDAADGLSAPQATPTPVPDGAGGQNTEGPTEDSPTENDDGGGEESEDGGAGESAADPAAPRLWPLFVLLLLAALATAAFFWRRLVWKRRIRRFLQPDINAAVLAVGRFAVELLRFAGCAPIEPLQMPAAYARSAEKRLPWLDGGQLLWLMELAQRARFSGRACTEQERRAAIQLTETVSGELQKRLPRMRRWIFMWRYPDGKRKKTNRRSGRR